VVPIGSSFRIARRHGRWPTRSHSSTASRGYAVVLAKRLQGPAAVHLAEEIAHVERPLLRLSHDFLSPIEKDSFKPRSDLVSRSFCCGTNGSARVFPFEQSGVLLGISPVG
jgi:hypothetical protein